MGPNSLEGIANGILAGLLLDIIHSLGKRLGNPTNLRTAGDAGRAVQRQAFDQFVRGVLPILDAVRRSGGASLAEIATALNERGVRSASGGKWHRSAVRNLLAREQSCVA